MDQAKSYLRSKKALQDLLVKRVGSLETLEKVILGIEQAAGDLEVRSSACVWVAPADTRL